MSNKIDIEDIAKLFKSEFNTFKQELKIELNKSIEERLQKNKEEIVKEVSKSLEQANNKIEELKLEVATLKANLEETVKEKETEKELNDIKSRRNNIIIGNIKEQVGENVPEVVISFIKDTLKVPTTVADLNYAKRLGRQSNSAEKSRPILFSFVSLLQKQKILDNKKLIEGSLYYIKGDYTYKQRTKRAELIKVKKNLKQEGKKVDLRQGKLIVEALSGAGSRTTQNVDIQKRNRSSDDSEFPEAELKKQKNKKDKLLKSNKTDKVINLSEVFKDT
ncbi:M protein, serotype 6-like [Condylostylus longicornis]|uniref:M protein, serotype 6-like n=1 Tax=Condylostylus longicornis TaxID=2530218 RepID=UPI00244DB58A|nr:M protein, serotype 6-like [Condylostylus longicornis]